jgi:hypothetical protein
MDIGHTCGNGRLNEGETNASSKGCFFVDHLCLVSHKANMDTQRCIPLVQCSTCHRVVVSCSHKPARCTGPPNLEKILRNQYYEKGKVVKVILHYEDGSSEAFSPFLDSNDQ